jgi:16S rRNA processing protein RimM
MRPGSGEQASPAGLTAIARIVNAVGLRGDLRVQLLCSGPERLARLTTVFVGSSPVGAVQRTFAGVRVQQNGILVQLSGVEDRTAADLQRGNFIFVRDEESEAPADGSVRIDDLVGFDVIDLDGRHWGVIRDVYALPANDMWSVWTGSKEVLVPAVAAWVSRVDAPGRRVILKSGEGLFDV